MLWLLAPGTLVLIWVLYSMSPAKKAIRLVEAAAKSVEGLQAETDACREECRSEVSAAAEARMDDIQFIRLQAISMEELKKHATGLRLQPLRDAGVRNMADLQSWSQGRLENLRGVGPKSAATIPGIVQRISSSVKAQPIADPEPPFLRDKERGLVLAIYREFQCDAYWLRCLPNSKSFGATRMRLRNRCERRRASFGGSGPSARARMSEPLFWQPRTLRVPTKKEATPTQYASRCERCYLSAAPCAPIASRHQH